ncbi:MAG: penicillin acylase family protein [Gemmatimonadales bacterium]
MTSAFRRIIPAGLLAASLFALSHSWGPLPAIGPLLDPYNGLWGVARSAVWPASGTATLVELTDSVIVVYDDRAVPHIFAGSVADAQRALGYVVARDRLFQLELQARATAGRLTEWAGPAALELDRSSRRLALAATAEEEYRTLVAENAPVVKALEAFAEGVNAWIDHLGRGNYPIEYHLLNARPERWRPVYSLYLLKQMSLTLSFSRHDRQYPALADMVGADAARALIARNNPIQEPIVPNGASEPRYDFDPLPPPRLGPTTVRAAIRPALNPSSDPGAMYEVEYPVGSNNWAVAPARSATGSALLAGDPHLGLTLPSIWYEAHQVVSDTLDSYGATLIGTPAIVVGFNRYLAWTFTNNSADVVDYYRETVDSTLAPNATLLDGEWQPVQRRIEEYRDQSKRLIHSDTVFRSHRGLMIRDEEGWLSLRWTALEPSRTSQAIIDMNLARDVHQWLRATEGFDVPSQNGLVADREGNIAIRSLGRVPVRPSDYSFIWDGRTSASDWRGDYPIERLPSAVNPAQGFLASANQQPVDPRVDSTYWGRRWPTPWRAMRIIAQLRRDSAVTVEAMRRWQTDPGSARVEYFMPYLLSAATRVTGDQTADSAAARAAALLEAWDGQYTTENEHAVLFEAVLSQVSQRVWDELLDERGSPIFHPTEATLAQLMADASSPWWDDRSTAQPEGRDDIVHASLVSGLEATLGRYGEPSGGRWRWDRVRRFTIPHLLRLPGLDAVGVANQGGPSTLSPMAMRGSFGSSWRMVVDLGPPIRAWTTYPGGQSGNPASRFYRNRLAAWSAGTLQPATVPRTPGDIPADSTMARLLLVPRPSN